MAKFQRWHYHNMHSEFVNEYNWNAMMVWPDGVINSDAENRRNIVNFEVSKMFKGYVPESILFGCDGRKISL